MDLEDVRYVAGRGAGGSDPQFDSPSQGDPCVCVCSYVFMDTAGCSPCSSPRAGTGRLKRILHKASYSRVV